MKPGIVLVMTTLAGYGQSGIEPWKYEVASIKPNTDNKTRLSGEFDFALEWTPEPGEDGGPTTAGLLPGASDQHAATSGGPSIFTAIPEQLGFASNPGAVPSR